MNTELQLPKWIRLLSLLLTILIVPVLPFLALGWFLEPSIELWLSSSRQRPVLVSFMGFSALIADIFLPIPSSFVCTTLGQILGIFLSSLVCTTGLQIGSWLGWIVGRRWGNAWIERCCGAETLEIGRDALEDWGVLAIVFTRPIPLIAESVVLLLGTHHARYSRWFPALLFSNLSMALAWCSIGYWSQTTKMVLLGSMMSVMVPTSVLVIIQFLRRNYRSSP